MLIRREVYFSEGAGEGDKKVDEGTMKKILDWVKKNKVTAGAIGAGVAGAGVGGAYLYKKHKNKKQQEAEAREFSEHVDEVASDNPEVKKSIIKKVTEWVEKNPKLTKYGGGALAAAAVGGAGYAGYRAYKKRKAAEEKED